MNLNLVSRFVVALGILIVVGCKSDIPTYPVTGKVVDGKGNAIEGAAVSFLPDSGEALLAIGVTDASGVYNLKTKSRDGALAGSYKITIAKYEGAADDEPEEPEPSDADPYDITEEYPDDYDEAGESEKAARQTSANNLPRKYADASTSGLSATVVEGENTFDFTVEK